MICKAGDKLTPRMANELIKSGKVTNFWCRSTRFWAALWPRTSSTKKPGKSGLKAGDELTW